MPLLRTLTTNVCARDCFYCPFRAGRDARRETFSPDELARIVDQMHRSGIVEGVFLSSGVPTNGDQAMDRIAATAELLRGTYGYEGYLHLKIMPGASDAAIERVVTFADRVSLNLEAPSRHHLARLTSTKDLTRDLLTPLERTRRVIDRIGAAVSIATQYVVGAAGESDADLLRTTATLYKRWGLARTFYSAFQPVPDTPLDGREPESPVREHRLYQADHLIHHYGFDVDSLPFDARGHLPLDVDPKLAWARAHPDAFPVEVNTAPRIELLRVPGIGPRGVARLLRARRCQTIRAPRDLARLGIVASRALPWVTLDGYRAARQLPLRAQSGPAMPMPERLPPAG